MTKKTTDRKEKDTLWATNSPRNEYQTRKRKRRKKKKNRRYGAHKKGKWGEDANQAVGIEMTTTHRTSGKNSGKFQGVLGRKYKERSLKKG